MTDHRHDDEDDGERWGKFEAMFMVRVADHLDRIEQALTAVVERKLDAVIAKLTTIREGQRSIMADLTQLTADVAANTDVDQSAVVLLQGLKAALDAAGTDPAALAALSQSLQDSSTALAAAVVQNTPAAV